MSKLLLRNLSLAMCALLVALDQVVKAWAINALPGQSIVVIPKLFLLTYVENTGAAFGVFKGHTFVLAIISSLVLLVLLGAILSGKIKPSLLVWSLSLILAGGFGNCIDRLMRGFVIDYLDFSALFGFPVFNIADCCVVVGTGLVLIYFLFLEKRERKEPVDESNPAIDVDISVKDADREEA